MVTLAHLGRHADLERRYPALSSAARGISTPALRNMGTIGGNLCLDTRCNYYNQSEEWRRSVDYCMKEDGEVCWVAPSSPRCWAVWAGDLAPVLTVLDAEVRLVSSDGERTVPVSDLYRDDGIDYLKKRPEEILSEIVLPAKSTSDRCRSSFQKLRRRGAIDFPVLSVAASIWYDGNGSIDRCSVVLGSVASLPLSVTAVPELLVGRRLDEEAIREAARLCRRAATPLDNTDYMAQWRGKMVAVFAERALRACQ
jgi:4-hydroxybenzoyl-CoA reductase subunit beta